MSRQRKILCVCSDLLEDTSVGSARSMLSTARVLAEVGWSVSCMSIDHFGKFKNLSPDPVWKALPDRVISRFVLCPAPSAPPMSLLIHKKLLEEAACVVAKDSPDCLLFYGGQFQEDLQFAAFCRSVGVRTIHFLRNYDYPAAYLKAFDLCAVPTRDVKQFYADQGVRAEVLRSVVLPDGILTAQREPVFFTLICPVRLKGIYFFLRLADALRTIRPDIPFLVCGGRGGLPNLLKAARELGLDLNGWEQLHYKEHTPTPAEIYQITRVLLLPSIREPFGRVVVEALMNGIPVLASAAGSHAETVGQGGWVLSVPAPLQSPSPCSFPVPSEWINAVIRLADGETEYARLSRAAHEEWNTRYHPEIQLRETVEFFEHALSDRGC